MCVLLGLTATKIVTQKRLEFFREAGSGYNINAYFVALVVISTLEHALQVIIAAFFSVWLRHPFASTGSYWVHFLLLMWICVGWALLIPMIVPPDSVVLVAGFFFAFCGLMFSGAFPPVLYEAIYEGGFLPVFAGWVAPTRFFYEALTVGEYRCLPVQSGFTIPDSAENRQWNTSMMVNLGYAGNDPPATLRSCSGWYWSVVPAILIGITVRYMAILAMHGFGRAQQTKKPLLHMMKKDKKTMLNVIVFIIILAGLLCLTTWTFLRKTPWELKEVGDNFRDSIFDNILG